MMWTKLEQMIDSLSRCRHPTSMSGSTWHGLLVRALSNSLPTLSGTSNVGLKAIYPR